MELIDVMLAKSWEPQDLERIESNDNWALGEKFDGFREVMYIDGEGTVRLFNRSGAEHSANVPHLTGIKVPALADTILDGEGVGPSGRIESTKSIFGAGATKARLWQVANGQAKYYVFDCLRFRGLDVSSLPLRQRREALQAAVELLQAAGIGPVEAEHLVTSSKQAFYEDVVARGGEGVMAKNLNAAYQPGKRSEDLRKVKRVETWDAVVMGFTPGKGKYVHVIGALKYGFFRGGQLEETGTSSGMTDAERQMFADDPDNFIGRVVELEGHEMGKDGSIRHPRFVQFRDDKRPESCTLE